MNITNTNRSSREEKFLTEKWCFATRTTERAAKNRDACPLDTAENAAAAGGWRQKTISGVIIQTSAAAVPVYSLADAAE